MAYREPYKITEDVAKETKTLSERLNYLIGQLFLTKADKRDLDALEERVKKLEGQ